jgi:hypothetical protein
MKVVIISFIIGTLFIINEHIKFNPPIPNNITSLFVFARDFLYSELHQDWKYYAMPIGSVKSLYIPGHFSVKMTNRSRIVMACGYSRAQASARPEVRTSR